VRAGKPRKAAHGGEGETGMRTWMSVLAAAIAGAALSTGIALGQQTPAKSGCEAMKAGAPQKLEGQVTGVDANQHKISVKGNDGKVHEFQASPDQIRDFKVGDRIEANLRNATNC
jgi:hypothetical protein